MKNTFLIALTAATLAVLPVAKADTPLMLHYQLYAGGLDVVKVDMRYTLTDAHYDINAEGRTRGLWRTLVPWSAHVQAKGAVQPDVKVAPVTAIYDTIWSDKLKSVRMDFEPTGDIITKNTPPRAPGGRNEATPEQIRGSIDPVSAIALVLARASAGETACSGTIPAFDGRRRYDLVLASKGVEEMRKTDYNIYSGPAERCEITFTPVAGFPKKDEKNGFWSVRDNEKKDSPLIIWLARTEENGPVLPIRLQTDGAYGTIVAHLGSYEPLPVAQAVTAP